MGIGTILSGISSTLINACTIGGYRFFTDFGSLSKKCIQLKGNPLKFVSPSVVSPPVQGSLKSQVNDRALLEAAQKLEATFLAQMLKSAGLGQARDSFSGGAGEDQFASFLLDAQAGKIVESGGLGLTEALFESLKERQNDNQ